MRPITLEQAVQFILEKKKIKYYQNSSHNVAPKTQLKTPFKPPQFRQNPFQNRLSAPPSNYFSSV